MKTVLAVVAAACLVVGAGPAQAWGAKGHQLVGDLAAKQLTPHARAELIQILAGFGSTSQSAGPDLGKAAVWADCVRDVYAKAGGGFGYAIDPKFTPGICKDLAVTAEPARMIDYASRNWSQCVYSPGCHGAYHFADVTLQRGDYDPAGRYAGTSDHDVVHAIQAALLVLQDKPCPSPFNIKDKREAVLLLAHFAGDIHQPLHVGAVYLDDRGGVIDPDATPGDDHQAETRGGNSLKFGSDNNLHHAWDDVEALSFTPLLLSASKGKPSSAGPLSQWPVAWASETVVAARKAYAGVTYSSVAVNAKHQRYWIAQFHNQKAYGKARRDDQAVQVALAGKRLAELYNSVWP
jgi:hypothetical protein